MDLPVRGRRINGRERTELEVAALKQERVAVIPLVAQQGPACLRLRPPQPCRAVPCGASANCRHLQPSFVFALGCHILSVY